MNLPDVSCGTGSDFVAIRTKVDIEFLLYVREPFVKNRVSDVGIGCDELAMPGELENNT